MPQPTPAHTIVTFDLHGVLLKSDYARMAKILLKHPARNRFLIYCFNPCTLYTLYDLYRNKSAMITYFDELVRKWPKFKPCIPLVIEMANAQDLNQGTFAVVNALKKQGYTLHILSNIDEDVFKQLDTQLHHPFTQFDVFQGTSAQQRCAKPDPQAFKNYQQLHNPEHKKIVYIDNSRRNRTAAHAAGMVGILFKNGTKLKKELVKIGFKL